MKILKWIMGLLAGLAGIVALFAGGKSKQKVKEIKKNKQSVVFVTHNEKYAKRANKRYKITKKQIIQI